MSLALWGINLKNRPGRICGYHVSRKALLILVASWKLLAVSIDPPPVY
jgi:hypothetical protein